MKLQSPLGFAFSFLIAALALAGCSTQSQLVTQWSNPGYAPPPFKRIVVGGSGGESAVRRNFEDEFAAQLRSAGIDAVQSYLYVPEEQNLDEAKLSQVAKRAGADAALLARSVGVEQRTEYSPSYYPYPSVGIFGSHVGATYGFYGGPSVRRYEITISETTLYDVGKNDVVWTGTMKTTQLDDLNSVIKDYVATVIKALNEKNLLRSGK